MFEFMPLGKGSNKFKCNFFPRKGGGHPKAYISEINSENRLNNALLHFVVVGLLIRFPKAN